MRIWIYENCKKVAGNFHRSGGLVVVAKNEEDRDRLVAEADEAPLDLNSIFTKTSSGPDMTVFDLSGDYESRLFVFPDAGCC